MVEDVEDGSWKPDNQPTSRHDSLVVKDGRWKPGDQPTSRRDSLVVKGGSWKPGDRGGGQLEARRPTNELS